MKYETVCPACGKVRETRQHPTGPPRLCGSCARSLVWETRRLAALHDLIHRSRDIVSCLQALLRHSTPQGMYMDALSDVERDVGRLADDVMVAQLTIAAKGVAA